MADHGVVCSMSRSGNVWDNAAMESFFSKATGFGIGLSLSRTIIEAHGGQLSAGSDTQGTVVLFTLPSMTRDQ